MPDISVNKTEQIEGGGKVAWRAEQNWLTDFTRMSKSQKIKNKKKCGEGWLIGDSYIINFSQRV